MPGVCTVDDCDRTSKGRGFCSMHLKRVAAHGDPLVNLAAATRACTTAGCQNFCRPRKSTCRACTRRIQRSDPEYRRRELERDAERRLGKREELAGRQRMASYGLSADGYAALFAAQGGACAICGLQESVIDRRNGRVRVLCVDHDHDTGQIRGLLCSKCNSGIGMLGDSLARVVAAAEYLARFEKVDA